MRHATLATDTVITYYRTLSCPKLPCKFLGALPTSGTESGILVPSGMSAERKCYAAHNIAVVAGNDLWRRRGR